MKRPAKPVQLVPAWSTPAGRLKPLHGINNGPLCAGGLVDLTARHREIAVPWIRLHDCGWPEPMVVDLPRIVVRPDRDPEDPGAYDFRRTDDYLAGVAATGARIIYRLGTSIEHSPRKYDIAPPADPARYARYCLGIVRHCNEGWADGTRLGISHWEVWNEPDSPKMWSGDAEAFCRQYEAVARRLKAHDGSLQVGGPGITNINEQRFLPPFLEHCRRGSVPLDFLSWHMYADDPARMVDSARQARVLLDRLGLTGTASICTEWNYIPPGFAWDYGNEVARSRFAAGMDSPSAAAFAAAVLLGLQDAPIDIATFYTGDTFWFGLFDTYGRPRLPFWAFRLFRDLLETPRRVPLAVPGKGIAACAGLAEDVGSAAVMIAQHGALTSSARIALDGLPWSGATRAEWHLLGDQGPQEPVLVPAGGGLPDLLLPQGGVGLLRLHPA